ncbi:MAG: GNAT family N-acetyltransferase [Chitinophagaceae bacterium]|nr:GNAT family N-acetyltransferase [Chitinophagaceae bacterium]MBP6477457.1 GNAT family N-acetyltransferase [Chitinophagaceae bacterium]MBP7109200.1 GNAT family N-acetyltransferase [Chitinophagaceae bacterium]MBP7313915.1 GNAT family N-acetyltransferase [Chitinophagaceae bacterium]HQX96425.1 GNAT family N-acetyltransferase [Chitinophagaceae bacterium]
MSAINWAFKKFEELTSSELYAIMQLRNEVFVVEQNCVYQDADNKDLLSYHLMGWNQQKLVAYTRILAPGIAFEEASIGRVVTSPSVRRTGIGFELMNRSISKTTELFGNFPIRIGAQLYLQKFYTSLGFEKDSDTYLEDNIPHIEMVRP